MSSDDFATRMRSLECFHDLRLLPDTWAVLRVDGRAFSRLTETHFAKPFDARFHAAMVATATELLEQLQGVYVFTQSDEVSVLLRRDWNQFDRSVEKAVSIAAGIASATFTLTTGIAAHFDARVWLGPSDAHVVDYFRWRQSDCARCALSGCCYWALRSDGKSEHEATRVLEGMPAADKHELLFAHDINFAELPAWQRRGTGLYWERYEKTGFDPIRNEEVIALRRRIRVDDELPMKDEYDAFIATRIA